MRKKPVFLNLFQIAMPITAIASILHRLSGLVLFLMLPAVLFVFQQSIASASGFSQVTLWLSTGFSAFLLWFFLSALIYHMLAGLRHLFMDMHLLSASLMVGRASSAILLFVSIIFSIWIGYRLW